MIYSKNFALNVNEVEIRVREATTIRDACDPSPVLMSEIAQCTNHR